MHRNLAASVLALSLLTALAPLAHAADPAAPVLVEVQPNPEGPDRANEWVELANPTPVELELDGLYLTDHDPCFAPGQGFVEEYAWPLEGSIPAQSRLVVKLPSGCVNLANGGDELTLVTEAGAPIQSVAYGSQGDLPAPSDAESLTACELDQMLHGGWSNAIATPGHANRRCSIA